MLNYFYGFTTQPGYANRTNGWLIEFRTNTWISQMIFSRNNLTWLATLSLISNVIGKDTFKCHSISITVSFAKKCDRIRQKKPLMRPTPPHSDPLNLKWKLGMKLNEKVSSLIHTHISQINKEGKTKNEIYPFYCQFAETKRKTLSINFWIYLYLIFWAGGWLVLTNRNVRPKRMCYLVTSNRTYSRSNSPNIS